MTYRNGIIVVNDSTSHSEALNSQAHRVLNICLLEVHLVTYLNGMDVNGGQNEIFTILRHTQ